MNVQAAPRYYLGMRLVLCLVLAGCAHQTSTTAAPQPSPAPMEEVQLRACESCRHDLETCRSRETNVTNQSGAQTACMDEFFRCLSLQQLDTGRCAGLN